jgi:lipoate-protein ligase A
MRLPICDFTASELAWNLALDEAILQAVEAGELAPMVRVWEWRRPAVVLGASGRRADDVRLDACEADGVPLARRASGGGTVVLGPGAHNVTVVLPVTAAPGLDAVDVAQAYVLETLASTFRACGNEVHVQGSGDLTIHNRKCAGSAQKRLKRNFLVHSSILDAMDLTAISRYLTQPRRQPAYRADRPHSDFVANLGIGTEELMRTVEAAWCDVQPERLRPETLPWSRTVALVEEKYGDPTWVERF